MFLLLFQIKQGGKWYIDNEEYQDLIQIINTLPILSENPLDWNEKKKRTMVLASHLYEKVRE